MHQIYNSDESSMHVLLVSLTFSILISTLGCRVWNIEFWRKPLLDRHWPEMPSLMIHAVCVIFRCGPLFALLVRDDIRPASYYWATLWFIVWGTQTIRFWLRTFPNLSPFQLRFWTIVAPGAIPLFAFSMHYPTLLEYTFPIVANSAILLYLLSLPIVSYAQTQVYYFLLVTMVFYICIACLFVFLFGCHDHLYDPKLRRNLNGGDRSVEDLMEGIMQILESVDASIINSATLVTGYDVGVWLIYGLRMSRFWHRLWTRSVQKTNMNSMYESQTRHWRVSLVYPIS